MCNFGGGNVYFGKSVVATLVMILIVLFFAILTTADSIEDLHGDPNHSDILDEYILCRFCGYDISASTYLTTVSSPASRHAFNDTLFGKEVLIQVLSNNIIFDFPIITASNSDCVSVGEWEERETWFPGYRWKVCVCPVCGEFVGWLFQPLQPSRHRKKTFYGLILWSLIGESCKYYCLILLMWGVIVSVRSFSCTNVV
ncbi:hypothetical protein NE865_05610 [Phthorimaea operculella]|nr:hypothetical protein NE865_05610 [Phthorimaea operculella]